MKRRGEYLTTVTVVRVTEGEMELRTVVSLHVHFLSSYVHRPDESCVGEIRYWRQ